MSHPSAPEPAAPVGRGPRFGRDYWLLTSGQVVSTLGDRFQGLAIPLLALGVSGDPKAAGLLLALGSITSIMVGLFCGALVDRLDRRRVMVVTDLARSTLSVGLGVVAVAGMVRLPLLYAFAIAFGALSTLFSAANAVAIPAVVGRERLADALGTYRALASAVGIAGSSLAGVVYAVGAGVPFVLNGATLLVSAASLWLIRSGFREAGTSSVAGRGAGELLADIREGLAWLVRERVLRALTLVTAADAVRFGAGYLMLIQLARDTGAGPTGVGIVFAGAALGGVLGGALAGPMTRRFRLGRVATVMILVEALSFPLYGLAHSWWWLVPVAAFESVVAPVYGVALETYRVGVTPDEVRGRVISGMNVVTTAAGAAGTAASGVLVEAVGARGLVWIASAWMLLLAVFVAGSRTIRDARTP